MSEQRLKCLPHVSLKTHVQYTKSIYILGPSNVSPLISYTISYRIGLSDNASRHPFRKIKTITYFKSNQDGENKVAEIIFALEML